MTIDYKPTVTTVTDEMEKAYTAILSVPAYPTHDYPDRLALAACGFEFPEQVLFRGAQTDVELLRRIALIHRRICTIPLGEFKEVIGRRLAAQDKGRDHA